jgi:hypothetical protein
MAVQEPVGVACMITPWNFPIAMITRKVSSKPFFMCVILFHSQLDYILHVLLYTGCSCLGCRMHCCFETIRNHPTNSDCIETTC